ncbi:hypothetical protein TVD_09710 [Thioalkalivibrio versutus]|uniref:Uncharacterized protein n=1 Tax=Thioalkalivibrio versutus TaxID=106634 RepID=A0A0G3GA30_9GAMM|nr:hypothetical protein [Thioalkalivibrio versutus]AKJ95616.1 hypothetical protein TVD_09710 [Thioalkalivibrio versutus]
MSRSSSSTASSPLPTRHIALRHAFTVTLLVIGLWLMHMNLRVLPEAGVMALWIGVTLLIAHGGFRRHRVRRAAFLRGYLEPPSQWPRRLRGGPLMALRHLIIGALLGGLLLITLARIPTQEVWAALLVAGFVLVISEALFARLLRGHAHPQFAPELVRRGALRLTGMLLIVALLALALLARYPDLTGASLEQAVWFLVHQEAARSHLLEAGLQLAAAQDALRLWLGQQWFPQGVESLPALLGWLLVLAEQAFLALGFLLLANGLLPLRPTNDTLGDPRNAPVIE